MATGIQHSINTIALQTLQACGVAEAYAFATEKLCLSLEPEDMDLSPLGLGGLHRGLSTIEMAAAYSAFANNGVYNKPRTYLRVEDSEGNVILENESESHVAMKETTAYLMNKMLRTAVTSGTGSQANFSGMTIAGKTGTTSDNYDRYFVGYTPYYTAAVWVGYPKNARISYSGNPAITLWKLIMEPLHEELENKSFSKPESGLTTVTICKDSGLLATDACAADIRGSRVTQVEVAVGSEPTEECALHVMRNYCTEGKCLATENCPTSSVIQAAFLNHERVDYGSGVVAEDDAYLISSMEEAIGLRPTYTADGTAVYPETIGCPVHGTGGGTTVDPENPDQPGTDPDHPGQTTDPENPGATTDPENPGGTETTDPGAGEPTQPEETEPSGEGESGETEDPADPGDPGYDPWQDPNYNPDPWADQREEENAA